MPSMISTIARIRMITIIASTFVLVSILVVGTFVDALDNGVALTPPMGWLSWERFGCNLDCFNFPDTCIGENLYLQQAEELVKGEYLDAGYEYVNIDDCWSEKERDPTTGDLVEDEHRFPSGIRSLSDQLHQMGLKFGMYTDIGTKTCAGYPALAGDARDDPSKGYFEQDARKFAIDYQIDSIKVDGCHSNTELYNITYPLFGKALNATGRRILYNCQWPLYQTSTHHGEIPDLLNSQIRQTCNQWRNYHDIVDDWSNVRNIIDYWSRNTHNDTLVRAGGTGHWNDPDMLVVGNPGLSISEQKSQFALWAIFAAPLMISADLRNIPVESAQILLNKNIISVNQDPLGRQGWCVDGCNSNAGKNPKKKNGSFRIYVREIMPSNNKPCEQGESDTWAVVLANFRTIFGPTVITFDPTKHLPKGKEWVYYSAHDLYDDDYHELMGDAFAVPVDESSVRMFKVRKLTFPAEASAQ